MRLDLLLKSDCTASRFARLAVAASLLLVPVGAASADSSGQPILSAEVGLPTLTYSFVDSHPVILGGHTYRAEQFLFSITGFTVPGGDPTDYYTIFSFSNATLQQEVFGLDSYDLPQGWSFDPTDFTISTNRSQGIHATDPNFGLTLYEYTDQPEVTPANAPFEVYHQTGGVQPFTLNGEPVIIYAQPIPETTTGVSLGLGLLALGGLLLSARRKWAAL